MGGKVCFKSLTYKGIVCYIHMYVAIVECYSVHQKKAIVITHRSVIYLCNYNVIIKVSICYYATVVVNTVALLCTYV